MKITLNAEDTEKLNQVLEQKSMNIQAAEFDNSYLNENYDAIQENDVKLVSENDGMDEESAMSELFLSFLSLDSEDPLVQEMKTKCLFSAFRKLNPDMIGSNPFMKLNIKECARGKLRLAYNYFEPYEGFTCEDFPSDGKNNFAEQNIIGYFSQKTRYITLMEKDVIWMSITPHEINTMKKSIDEAHGDVVTYGLGLGYWAYMASMKDDVSSVTIVEKNSTVINIFRESILPLFPHKEKISIVQKDAFRHFERDLPEEHYDYCFIDIYHSPEEALPEYLRFKASEKNVSSTQFSYWIENAILSLMRRYVLTIIEEYFQGMTEKDYEDESTEENKILKVLYYSLRNYEASSFEEISSLLSDTSLRSLAETVIL